MCSTPVNFVPHIVSFVVTIYSKTSAFFCRAWEVVYMKITMLYAKKCV